MIKGTTHSVKMRLMESTMKREISSFRSFNMSNCSWHRGSEAQRSNRSVHGIRGSFVVFRAQERATEGRPYHTALTERPRAAIYKETCQANYKTAPLCCYS